MKKIAILTIILVLGCLIITSSAEEQKTFKCASMVELGVSKESRLMFQRLVEERSKGMLKCEMYLDGQLGTNDEDLSTSLSEGTIKVYWAEDMFASWVAPEWSGYTNVPFCFRDNDHCQAFWSSEIGKLIQERIIEKFGVLLITENLSFNPPRQLTANKPIYKIEDLKGLKLRTPLKPGMVAGWEAIGANVTPVQWGEVFGALQTGIVDAQENPLYSIKAAGLYQVQKYIMFTNHQIQANNALINYEWWKTLSEEEQEIILDALKESHEWRTKALVEEEEIIIQEFKNYGIQFVESSEIDIQAFKEKIDIAIKEKFDKEWAPGGWDKIQSL